MKLLLLLALLSASLSAPALAQEQTPPPGIMKGDFVRVWFAPSTHDQPGPLVGRVLSVGTDSLTLVGMNTGIAWADMKRLQSLEQDHTQEMGGVGIGLVVGGGLGWLAGEIDGGIAANGIYGVVGAVVGAVIGAVTGSRRSRRSWVEVSLE